MAAKVLSSPPHPQLNPNPHSYPSSRPLKILQVKATRDVTEKQKQPWRLLSQVSSRTRANKKRQLQVVGALSSSLHDCESLVTSSLLVLLQEPPSSSSSSLFVVAADSVGYSSASYYTSLGLFVLSVPGLWSLIKRSVKSKVRHFRSNFTFYINYYIILYMCLNHQIFHLNQTKSNQTIMDLG